MSLSADVLDRAWDKLGMDIQDRKKDRFAYFRHDGKMVLFTRRSYGRGKVSDYQSQLIRQQLRLNEVQFSDLVSCPLDRNGYVQILKDKNLIQ